MVDQEIKVNFKVYIPETYTLLTYMDILEEEGLMIDYEEIEQELDLEFKDILLEIEEEDRKLSKKPEKNQRELYI
ncbi:MAG: hypothetical protein ACTSVU_04855 [Promethearchaeota archaeon]